MSRFQIPPIPSSEITPKQVYLTRRDFIRAAGVIAGSVALAACAPKASESIPETAGEPASGTAASSPTAAVTLTAGGKDELGDPVNPFSDITHYNNYYEFTTDKEGVARAVEGLQDLALGRGSLGPGEQAGHVQRGRPDQEIPARGAHLPPALRGSLEHGHPLDGLPAREAAQGGGAHRRREIRALRDHLQAGGDARAESSPSTPGPTRKACAWTKPCTT